LPCVLLGLALLVDGFQLASDVLRTRAWESRG
jgi:hypothetical protein